MLISTRSIHGFMSSLIKNLGRNLGFHLQFVHFIVGPILVHYITPEIPAAANQKAGPHYDHVGLVWSFHVVHSGFGLEPNPEERTESFTR